MNAAYSSINKDEGTETVEHCFDPIFVKLLFVVGHSAKL